MKKMPKSKLLELFPEPVVWDDKNDPNITSNATKKNHKHQPSRKPIAGRISPALYRRRHLGRKR